ncbi:MAG: nucleotidyltransferase family protein [Pseudomonadota bacterium]
MRDRQSRQGQRQTAKDRRRTWRQINIKIDTDVPEAAIVLAAGLGLRMRPLTETTPKPLLKIADRPILFHILDRLLVTGVKRIVVNAHHLAEQIEAALATYRQDTGRTVDIHFSDESERLLDSGGGVKAALSHLGDEPFYIINGDSLWDDGVGDTLKRLAHSWRRGSADQMQALLLMIASVHAQGYRGRGDFHMDPDGRLTRRQEHELAPFVFGGVQILSPGLFDATPDTPFSLNRIFNEAIEHETLFGQRHDGTWYHVSTPSDLERTQALWRT